MINKVIKTAVIQRKNLIDERYLLNSAYSEITPFNEKDEEEHRNLVSSLADLIVKSIEI